MADNQINVVFSAITEDFKSGLQSVNDALGYVKLQAESTQNPIGELFNALQKSSDSAIAGLIKGTENWHQATLKIIQDLEIKFAQLAANRLLHDFATESFGLQEAERVAGQRVAVNQAANDAMAASDQQAGNSGIAAMARKAVASIYNDAREAFAGIYAFLSPVMGPAAAGPAEAGSAAVLAQASGITYAESGAWNIPDNTLAYLHTGEMVVPQPFANSLRSGNGFGGGDNYTININAIDTQTGVQFLKNNASAIASVLSSQARNFNRNAPAWKS